MGAGGVGMVGESLCIITLSFIIIHKHVASPTVSESIIVRPVCPPIYTYIMVARIVSCVGTYLCYVIVL